MKSFEEILEGILPEVSFGVETIRVGRPQQLSALQTGYSISPTGKPLTGTGAGDWRKEWVVIGCSESCGDPLFIDSSISLFPVYTAIHGEGSWKEIPIAMSLEAFGQDLSAVAYISKGREHPAALESNPLSQAEKDATLAIIQRHNPDMNLEFWKNLLS